MTNDRHSPSSVTPSAAGAPTARRDEYVVVARRYRPQTFEELVGQQQVTQALRNAITTGRVGHAYLFTGARGVGKTSAARILAKALNCVRGPTPQPCNVCDNCERIAAGEDVDVLEIDGASNRGIDEIRQLRSNVGIRPSRSRFKVYIIDEVHMLTVQAFNALLKTLEEPPEHVKFIFCTTDPEKVPITVLSRCQRFDFAGIRSEAILERLSQIAQAEGATVAPEALQILARRAAGSMRDSQSLLEQLLAFGQGTITEEDVHAMLGTARSGQLERLVDCLAARDAAGAIAALDAALSEGVDVGQLVEQLLGWLRDMLVAAVGCEAGTMLSTAPDDFPKLRATAQRWGLAAILAAMQILDHTVQRMRQTTYGRILAELALVRICELEQLERLTDLRAQVESGAAAVPPPGGGSPSRPAAASQSSVADRAAAAPPEKKTTGSGKEDASAATAAPAVHPKEPPPVAVPAVPLTADTLPQIWSAALAQLSGLTADYAAKSARIAILGPNRLVISFPKRYTLAKGWCEGPTGREQLERAISAVVGQRVVLEFTVEPETAVETPASTARRATSPRQRIQAVAAHPMVREVMDLFDAEVTQVDDPSEDNGGN